MSDPDWWKQAVFYQIYPRSFYDTSGNGIGDLKGITKKLDYIAKLGVDGIWISPFFQSPMKDFGYDLSDYREIDPLFGTMDDFDMLLEQAHDRNLKVIIDMVLNHTSDQHSWFQESCKNKTNPKSDWYVWVDTKEDGSPPNNWVSVFGGSAWEWNKTRQQYYLHNFLKEQPDLNYHNPEIQKSMLDECRFWLNKGVDGLRLDVINFIFHDKELRDNPPKDPGKGGYATQLEKPDPYNDQQHVYDKSRPEALEFIEKLRSLTDEYPGVMTLAEIGDDNATQRAAEYVANNKRLHTAYSFSLMTGNNITASKVKNAVTEFLNQPGNGWPSWAFSNHDVTRSVTRWGKNIKDKEAFAILLNKLLLSLYGTPFLYQGEELGLLEAELTFDQLRDPWGKHHWPDWPGRDGCRTPMPWRADAPQSGFSDNPEIWLPIPDTHKIRAVDTQESDPKSVLDATRIFIQWRKDNPVLQTGNIEFLETGHEKVLAFKRSDKETEILCLFNLSEEIQSYQQESLSPLEASFKTL